MQSGRKSKSPEGGRAPEAFPTRSIALLAALVALAIPTAGAAECVPTTTDARLCSSTIRFVTGMCIEGDYGGVAYATNWRCLPGVDELDFMCPWDLWIYLESNDIPGLQRQDGWHDDTCGGMIESDTLVF